MLLRHKTCGSMVHLLSLLNHNWLLVKAVDAMGGQVQVGVCWRVCLLVALRSVWKSFTLWATHVRLSLVTLSRAHPILL